MLTLGYVESATVLDEYAIAEVLTRFFDVVEVEEGEEVKGTPHIFERLGKAAWLAGSDEYDSLSAKVRMPDDDPASAAQVMAAHAPGVIIDIAGKAHKGSGGNMPCSVVDGRRYHSFIADVG